MPRKQRMYLLASMAAAGAIFVLLAIWVIYYHPLAEANPKDDGNIAFYSTDLHASVPLLPIQMDKQQSGKTVYCFVSLMGKRGVMCIDTGSNGNLLSTWALEQIGGQVPGKFVVDFGPLAATVTFDGVLTDAHNGTVEEHDYLGLIGQPLLSQMKATLDLYSMELIVPNPNRTKADNNQLLRTSGHE